LEEGKDGQDGDKKEKDSGPKVITKTYIKEDGTYGTQTIVLDDPQKAKELLKDDQDDRPLRKAITVTEDDYLGNCLAISLSKLVIKTKKNLNNKYSQMAVDSILIICAVLKVF
jgi:hypothetical protein